MKIKANKSFIESLSESDVNDLMLLIEEHAIRQGYRNFVKIGDEFNISAEIQAELDTKFDEDMLYQYLVEQGIIVE